MPRRERRLGVMYIDNDKDRDVTFFKRRGGLYKGAADLSVLTGAKVAVVLEKDNGKMHSFGAPSAKPIVDAFLLGHPPTTPLTNRVTTSRIKCLQGEVARLDMENMKEGKRNQLSIQHMKEIQDDNPGMEAKLLFSKEEDLSLEDLDRLFNDLLRVQDDIRRRLPPLHNGCNANTRSSKSTMWPAKYGLPAEESQTMDLATPEWELGMKSVKDDQPIFPRKETPSTMFLP
ncbi:hypothetical protein QYE76_028931 [Lolium multiflorum]|uniref:MADS-box domain-containing protein n=1 Tax=Lolium multiflorum TaxID=4521 RepID=A0AAD8QLV6_LOLMU|nr:hypothetical protein QYE76_028931 [Lolium multiflorum]